MTDFGTRDVYVGVLKGVLASQSPQAKLIDLSHHVPAGDVAAGAFKLWQAAPYFPAGTVFLAVVDPGVGSDRRGIVAAWKDRLFVGPDNGLISYWMETQAPESVHQLKSGAVPASQTFHGRDIFAPAAAQLVSGTPAGELGPPIDELVRLPRPHLQPSEHGRVEGQLLQQDAFGNWVTSIGVLSRRPSGLTLRPWLGGEPVEIPGSAHTVRLPGGTEITLHRSFSDVPPGSGLAYIGSSGLLEIGVNRGSADDRFSLRLGERIELVAEA